MKKWIKIAFIRNTHGVKGEIVAESLSDIDDRLFELETIFIGETPDKEEVIIENVRSHKGCALIKLKDFDSINDSSELKRKYLYIKEEDRAKLPKDSFYIDELINLRVIDLDNGKDIGYVKNIIENVANPVIQIETKDGDRLVPFVSAFVEDVDVENGQIFIHLIEGI